MGQHQAPAPSRKVMEHRWGTRIPLDASAQLRSPKGGFHGAVVRDASISGAFVETTVQLPLLSQVALRPVSITGQWIDACVVRVEEDGMALEWLEPELHAVSALLALRADARVPPRRSRAEDSALWYPDAIQGFLTERRAPLQP